MAAAIFAAEFKRPPFWIPPLGGGETVKVVHLHLACSCLLWRTISPVCTWLPQHCAGLKLVAWKPWGSQIYKCDGRRQTNKQLICAATPLTRHTWQQHDLSSCSFLNTCTSPGILDGAGRSAGCSTKRAISAVLGPLIGGHVWPVLLWEQRAGCSTARIFCAFMWVIHWRYFLDWHAAIDLTGEWWRLAMTDSRGKDRQRRLMAVIRFGRFGCGSGSWWSRMVTDGFFAMADMDGECWVIMVRDGCELWLIQGWMVVDDDCELMIVGDG